MRELIKVTGLVLKASPIMDFDKRLVVLTKERGKITVFSRGAKRPGSQLMAPSRPFVFGTFSLFEGKDSYSLQGVEVSNYFEELCLDLHGACYGSYFLELADYYTRENINETDLLKLLYQSLRALLKPTLPNQLVRRIFELRIMVINGEYTQVPPKPVCESAAYTWEYVIFTPLESLYTFLVTQEVLNEFSECVEHNKRMYIDRVFHSLEILEAMTV